jgi:cytidine deaminase
MEIDWPYLRAAAADVAGRAYAPYSRLRVGAAGLTDDGQVVAGCNVENASFGLTLCAECGLVSALHATPPSRPGGGPPALVAVAVVAGDGGPLLPCGRCRQLLLEAGGPALLVDTPEGPRPLGELLPAAFGGADLSSRRESPPHHLALPGLTWPYWEGSMSRRDLIDPESRQPLDQFLAALPGGFNSVPDIVARRDTAAQLLAALGVPPNSASTRPGSPGTAAAPAGASPSRSCCSPGTAATRRSASRCRSSR